jgi:NAD(P)-dependent dehydrogenase (short-subunit alcohol dehydrogenase family)
MARNLHIPPVSDSTQPSGPRNRSSAVSLRHVRSGLTSGPSFSPSGVVPSSHRLRMRTYKYRRMLVNAGFQWFTAGPSVASLVVQEALPEREGAPKAMQAKRKTMIVTGAGQGIGAGVANAFIERGYNVVANSRNITNSALVPSERLALVDGNIGEASTAATIVATATSKFGSIDGVVNNAGIFFSKPFTEYTVHDFDLLSETNLQGYLHITQLAVKQMLIQKTGGSVTSITAATVDHPIWGVNGSVPMMTKGGLEAITRSLAMEYAKEGIRFNAVAPGVVDTPMHANDSSEFLKSLSPMGEIPDIADIVEAIIYLTEARHVTGEVLHVDAGAHNGKW